ncbi:hypothetical protein FQV39_02475 [Bosea sp. F3-2]|uniref:hypothetical protein n=1 Tax=Bosea sp. F3-2 TaxID=2599640 RepID=UPI0011F0787D|nr:hypothetical protein [Bosea sp. F3-2]QEL21570.1 hypothetical protein FQV39_02475 [Bosea sp. F3-2]
MSTKFRTTVFLFAVLALSGVALAQQARGTGGQSAAHADAILQGADQGRVRVPNALRLRYAETGCTTGICSEPPKSGPVDAAPAGDACSSLGTARDRNGRVIRRLCAFN